MENEKNEAGPRMRTRDAAATRRRLLEVAERHFVGKGYDASRVDEIATEAGINKRMIYAYFGDKEGLYLAVLRTNLERALDAVRLAAPLPADPRERAVVLIRRFFSFLGENPAFVRLATWETLLYGRRAGRVLHETLGAALEQLHLVLEQGKREGVYRPDLDVRKVTHSVSALCLTFFAQREFLEALWKEDLGAASAREEMLAHILRLVFEGIDAREPAGAQAPARPGDGQ
jgi:TetR/AcrR family transcriptional regulator